MFSAKYPDGQVKIDELSRWWSEWYTYKNIIESQEIVYNQCILISPNACPDRKKYIQWSTELKLTSISESNEEENFHLVVPLNFKSIYQYNQTGQKNNIDQSRSLQKQCNRLGILPPTFGSNSSRKPKAQINKTE